MWGRKVISAVLRSVGSMGVPRAEGVHQDSAFPMVAVTGAKNQVAIKGPRAERRTANLMEEESGAKS